MSVCIQFTSVNYLLVKLNTKGNDSRARAVIFDTVSHFSITILQCGGMSLSDWTPKCRNAGLKKMDFRKLNLLMGFVKKKIRHILHSYVYYHNFVFYSYYGW